MTHFTFLINDTDKPDLAAAITAAKEYRNLLLRETDPTQLPDHPLNINREIKEYRQALRDLPDHPDFPDIKFPEPPAVLNA